MWYVRKAASKVMKVSQNVFKQQSQVQKLIKDIISNKHDMMPTKKMSTLSGQSFDIDKFEKIMEFMTEKLNDINIQKKSLKKRLNLLVLTAYLIKYGASGFIDQFRSNINIFTKYQNLINTESVQQNQKLTDILNQIRDRAKYIRTLLNDKTMLTRQKEVGRIVKEKLMIQSGDYSKKNQSQKEDQSIKQQGEKVESFLQHYIWRYTAKLDKKVNDITDTLISKIDQYLDGQMPQGFQIDEIEKKQKNVITKSQFELTGGKQIIKQQIFIKQKLPTFSFNKNVNLLDLQTEIASCQKNNLIYINKQQNLAEHQIQSNGYKSQISDFIQGQVNFNELDKQNKQNIKKNNLLSIHQ